jgi:uncharacterized membrane protein HdeD (DUF308 family)
MVVAVEVDVQQEVETPRWEHVVLGVLWLLLALILLSLDVTSAVALGYVTAFVLIGGGIDELVQALAAPSWRWMHAIAAFVFVLGGIGALLAPFQTYGYLALFIGYYLIIKGSLDFGRAIGLRALLPLWGVTCAVGLVEVALGLWALGYPGRSAWLLLVWTGTAALLRAVSHIVAAVTGGT